MNETITSVMSKTYPETSVEVVLPTATQYMIDDRLYQLAEAIKVGLSSIAVAIVISTLIVCYFKFYRKPKE